MGGNNRNRRGRRNNQKPDDRVFQQQQQAKRATYTQQQNVVDYLSEDEEIPSQKFVCLSFASISDDMRDDFLEELSGQLNISKDIVTKVVDGWCKLEHPKRAVKVRGSASSPEEIVQRAKRVREMDDNFHIFTCEVGKWLAFDPNPEMIEDENYMEEQLNELVKGYKQNKLKTKTYFEQRRREMMEKAISEGTSEGQKLKLLEEEPTEAIEHRVKQADDYISELEGKIDELKRTKELALNKLSNNDDGTSLSTKEIEALKVEMENKEGKSLDEETKSKVETLREMQESARKAELGDLARELGNRQQAALDNELLKREALKEQLASDQLEEMEKDVLIPSQIRNDYKNTRDL